jgi:hypothetical protein
MRRACQRPRRIDVEQRDASARREGGGDVGGERRLAGTALLLRDRDDHRH